MAINPLFPVTQSTITQPNIFTTTTPLPTAIPNIFSPTVLTASPFPSTTTPSSQSALLQQITIALQSLLQMLAGGGSSTAFSLPTTDPALSVTNKPATTKAAADEEDGGEGDGGGEEGDGGECNEA